MVWNVPPSHLYFVGLCWSPRPRSGLSLSLVWSLFLPSLSFFSSFLILFISRRDAPQRHPAELSDLNKCLRLEPALSCGLCCRCGRQCCQSVPPFPPPPPSISPPSLFVTLSLWRLFLMAGETCGKPLCLCLGLNKADSRGRELFSYHTGFYLDADSMWIQQGYYAFSLMNVVTQNLRFLWFPCKQRCRNKVSCKIRTSDDFS